MKIKERLIKHEKVKCPLYTAPGIECNIGFDRRCEEKACKLSVENNYECKNNTSQH